MTAAEIISEVRSLGGHLEVRGDKLRVEAPVGAVTGELRVRLREHKPELLKQLELDACLSAIRANNSEMVEEGRPAESPHEASLKTIPRTTEGQKSDAELIEEYRANRSIRIEYKGSAVWLVATAKQAECIDDGTAYTMEEWQRIVRESDNNEHIRMIHDLRTLGGLPAGSVVIQKTESAP